MRPTTDLQRTVAPFRVVADFEPSGDQPAAIADLTKRIQAGEQDIVLLGATGTGKSATTAWLIEQVQRPTLVMAPNKTLAAQLANEFRELLPDNAVEYFVSYYDYYQPEAYIAQTDTYIEKDSSINDEVERLRHSATNSLLTRRDVIVVASVSCIYGLGTPQEYVDRMARLKVGAQIERDDLLRRFVAMQYTRNDLAFTRGTFRVRGDTVEIIPVYEQLAIRIEFFGDEIERIYTLHPLTGEIVHEEKEMYVFPATHYVAGPERMERAVRGIEAELEAQLAAFERQGKLLEAQRLRMRTTYDLEMMRQVGSCSGIENYSLHIDGRLRGSAPNCLLDYFPEDFLLVIDESHVTVPQIGAMYEGDLLVLIRPFRLDQIDQAKPSGRELADPIAQGAVMFDVGHDRLLLDVRSPVEVTSFADGQPRISGIIGQRPPDRVSRRIGNRPPERSTRAASAMTAAESATNGTAPYDVKTVSNEPSPNGRLAASHCTSGTVNPDSTVKRRLRLRP